MSFASAPAFAATGAAGRAVVSLAITLLLTIGSLLLPTPGRLITG